MTRIAPFDPASAAEPARKLLAAVQAKLGLTPNMMKTMAHSPAVLEGYLQFAGALERGALDRRVREQLALAAAQANRCDYCLSAHTALGQLAGLTADEMTAARAASASDSKTEAGLRFARDLSGSRGQISDGDISAVRAAGYSDGEIGEIIAHVALNVFTNYFNLAAGTDIDFARVTAG